MAISIDQLKEFVSFQVTLLRTFKKDFNDLKDWAFLLDFPKSGKVKIESVEWSFQKHGAGLRFERNSDGLVIDAHNMLKDPKYFDAWRLVQYFISRGENYDEKTVKDELNRLEKEGLLEESPDTQGLYRLR